MTRRVLIVDDEPAILRSTQLLLQDMGFETATAARAEDILPTALRARPDVILQDVHMPGLDLEALVGDVRSHEALAKVHIVVFTAGADAAHVAARLHAPVLEKPFRPDELLAAIG